MHIKTQHSKTDNFARPVRITSKTEGGGLNVLLQCCIFYTERKIAICFEIECLITEVEVGVERGGNDGSEMAKVWVRSGVEAGYRLQAHLSVKKIKVGLPIKL